MEVEAFRQMRACVLRANGEPAPRTILVTSPAAGEGKSTVAINLAAALAQKGKTCLMDADLRQPTISTVFHCPAAPSWVYVLSGTRTLDQALVPSGGNLTLLTSGLKPANPGEIVGSEKMGRLMSELQARFDYIVIDSPPSIPFSDALELSQVTDGVLLVGRCGLTTRRALTRCAEGLQEAGARILGVVVNGMDFSAPDYRYYNFGHSSAKLQGYYHDNTPEMPDPPNDSSSAKARGASAGSGA